MKRVIKMQIVFAVITLVLMTLFIVFVVNPRRANATEIQPQFEDYKWGSTFDEVKEIIISKGHHIDPRFTQPDLGIMISSDKILGWEVKVYFHFTSKTRKLYMVSLFWDKLETAMVCDSLLRILTKKYGPAEFDKDEGRYWWQGESVSLCLSLTRAKKKLHLMYLSEKYSKLSIQENSEITEAQEEEDEDKL